jgi:molybdopterin-containing oxidoreductase family membrane subunit
MGLGYHQLRFGGWVLVRRCLISAILLLFRRGWPGVNRAAKHDDLRYVCRPVSYLAWRAVWMAFFVMPYPNTRGPLWVNFNSPLLWDVFAIGTYFTVSLLFWYTGLLPDLATVRDRARVKWRKFMYGMLAFGWLGSTKHWQRHESLSLVLAGLSTWYAVLPWYHRLRHFYCPGILSSTISLRVYLFWFAMVQTLLVVTRKYWAGRIRTLEHIM